ncbi:hypothetical protein M501DRAFT_991941 [Patellaria atrata CBS 101060]|uniref:Uncharacterized protein n=1 Tax=Patellaria atrata CBS 101060 TaxID=1346257 RepID=A0A9P4VTV3_9PEZI|nr:hypothetical protein M501DRAFT_991941 [Patellaria atrata CBS 101060]
MILFANLVQCTKLVHQHDLIGHDWTLFSKPLMYSITPGVSIQEGAEPRELSRRVDRFVHPRDPSFQLRDVGIQLLRYLDFRDILPLRRDRADDIARDQIKHLLRHPSVDGEGVLKVVEAEQEADLQQRDGNGKEEAQEPLHEGDRVILVAIRILKEIRTLDV